MQPRLMDARVGYFDETQDATSARAEQRVMPRRYITRWRLECGEQKVGSLCVPKKPITYYVDPATPAWLVPWVKARHRGVAAGVRRRRIQQGHHRGGCTERSRLLRRGRIGRHGALAAEPGGRTPSVRQHDRPAHRRDHRRRRADVSTTCMDLQRNWYFSQVGHLDPRAQKFPFPDSLMGRLVQFVVAHEVGHTLGFPHNFKGSSMYPLDSLRSKTWVAQMGHSPSIMDYARFNYVAQPEDKIAARRPRAEGRTVRPVRGDVGLRADPGRDDVRKTSARRSTSGRACRTQSRGSASPVTPARAAQIRASSRKRSAMPTRCARRSYGFRNTRRVMKLVEPASTTAGPTARLLAAAHDVRRGGRTVGDGSEPRRAHHRRDEQAGEGRQRRAGPVWTHGARRRRSRTR